MPPLYVGWSLNYEMFFYFIFGLSLYFRKNRTLFLTLLIISLTSTFHIKKYLDIDLLFFINDEHIYNLITNQLLLQFLLGIIFSKIYKHLKFKKTKAIIFSILLSLIFIIYYFSELPIGSYDIIFSGMLVLSFLILDRNELFTTNNFLTKLGDISYSLYLIHPIVIILVERFINSHEILFSNFSTFIFILILTYLFSLITFNLIELRITKKLREMLN
jgi:peptidoglycan/LPS O-acetylase OafA/YrhL